MKKSIDFNNLFCKTALRRFKWRIFKAKLEKNKIVFPVLALLVLVTASCAPQDINNNASSFDRSTNGLSAADESKAAELSDGQTFQIAASPVSKDINGITIRMYAYNKQIPGPLIKVKQGSTIYVNFTNNLDMDTTIHWHGVRLENEFDGVPNVTQQPVKPKETFLYKVKFPDEGVYWYHTHVKEDMQQELGLYGGIFAEPKDEFYFNKVDKEVFLFLDDIKMAKDDVDIFGKDFVRFALMGRFGNVMLTNGQNYYKLNANKGDIIRFYLIDTANTRTFNFSVENHKLKLIGSDSGKYEKEELKDSITIAPAERYIAEALFENNGTFKIVHKTPSKTYILGEINVKDANSQNNDSGKFYELKENKEIKSSIDNFRKYFSKEPDFQIDLTVNMSSMQGMDHSMMQMDSKEKIEWEDEMPSMNAMSTSKNTKWIIKDKATGKENMDINYKVKVGDVKKIRIFNDPKSMHPMQHPMHLHGQRFLVLRVDGKQNDNLAWKDTVLVPKGSTVDILVEFTNPGNWMMHCHIAEHLEDGMMSMFTVYT